MEGKQKHPVKEITIEEEKHPISEIIERLPTAQVGKPSFARLGNALGALTEAGLHKIGMARVLAYNEQQNLELSKNLERLVTEFQDEEPVVTIPVELAQPVIERLSFVKDSKIAGLFIKLLSTAGHEASAGLAHPSFVHVIDQLTPDEAILLNALEGVKDMEFIEYGVKNPLPEASGATYIHSHYFSRLYEIEDLSYPENCEFYMDNLISLGLLSTRNDWFIGEPDDKGKNVPSSEYTRLEELATEKIGSVAPPFNKYIKTGILSPTNKGMLFIKIAKDN